MGYTFLFQILLFSSKFSLKIATALPIATSTLMTEASRYIQRALYYLFCCSKAEQHQSGFMREFENFLGIVQNDLQLFAMAVQDNQCQIWVHAVRESSMLAVQVSQHKYLAHFFEHVCAIV